MNTTSGAGSPSRILIVDDDVTLLEGVESAFRAAGEDATSCSSFELARQMLRSEEFEVLVTDVRLGAFNGAISVLGRVPSFVVTLGSLSVFTGTALSILAGATIMFDLPISTRWEAAARLLGVDVTQLTAGPAGHA